VAVFGRGFTRSTADVLLTASTNARSGIATIATNVVGHSSGAASTWQVTSGGRTVSFPSYGRGVDQDGNGVVESTEGPSATAGAAPASSRDALRQTTGDLMTLVRALDGADVTDDGVPDLSGRDVTYFGQSFGGTYGTMRTGVDDRASRSVLDVPGVRSARSPGCRRPSDRSPRRRWTPQGGSTAPTRPAGTSRSRSRCVVSHR